MSKEEEIKVGDIVKFQYKYPCLDTYRLGIVRDIERTFPEPVLRPKYVRTKYHVELLGEKLIQTYIPTGRTVRLFDHDDITKYHTPNLISEQVMRGSVAMNSSKPSAASLPAETTSKILAMAGLGQNSNLYRRYMERDPNMMPRTAPSSSAASSSAASLSAAPSSSAAASSSLKPSRKSNRNRSNKTRRNQRTKQNKY